MHVIHTSAFGGGPNMLAILCAHLSGDFAMEVVTDGHGDMPARVEAAGTVVHRMPLTTKWSFASHIPRLAGLVRRRKPDLVHLHGQFAGSFGQIALALAGGPRNVYFVQWPSYLDDGGGWSRFRNRTAEKVSCDGATSVVCVSENDRREFIARGLCAPEKLRVIHNAFSRDTQASRPPFAGGVPTIGFVGRLVDQKGCEYLVRAVPAVLEAHPDTRFLIVGDGLERPRLEAMARELGVSSAVEFAGYQPEPAPLIERMDVVVVPSIYDPFPLVTLEAMILSRPVVGAAVGGIPEQVEDGRTGILVPPRDAGSIASALIRLISQPRAAAAMGGAGRDSAKARFSPEVISGQFAALYRELLATAS